MSADNGSRLELLSATESGGHGETTDLVIVDEAWVHQDATAEQAVRPTMATRADAQLWAMSTAGTPKSVWWRSKLDAARTGAELGVTSGVCLLEWAASPEADPTDEAAWWATMPALGRLIEVDTVRADLANRARSSSSGRFSTFGLTKAPKAGPSSPGTSGRRPEYDRRLRPRP